MRCRFAVSLLLHACAPEAKLFHIKIFNENGMGASGSVRGDEALFAKALEVSGARGATIVNISAGLPRSMATDEDLLDRNLICSCRICSAARDMVLRGGASVFAAAGNAGQPSRNWMCPAAGPCVTAVVGLKGKEPLFASANLARFTYGLLARIIL